MATRSRLPIALVWLLVAPVIPAMLPGQGVTHVEVRQGWSRNPATDAEMTDRLRGAASQYRTYAPIPRIAVYNIGYPSSPAEYEALNGYGAIVVTVVAQDSAELPSLVCIFAVHRVQRRSCRSSRIAAAGWRPPMRPSRPPLAAIAVMRCISSPF
jgi:hypothetical protein